MPFGYNINTFLWIIHHIKSKNYNKLIVGMLLCIRCLHLSDHLKMLRSICEIKRKKYIIFEYKKIIFP